MNAAAFCCLLAGATDYGPPCPLPDRPPGLPCRDECHRRSWRAWHAMQRWQDAAHRLPEADRKGPGEVVCHLHDVSWAWWHAGHLADPCTGRTLRRGARAELLGLINHEAYLHGWMPAAPD